MRKVILSVAVSLDGFIEGPNGEYDWCFGHTDQDYGMSDFIKTHRCLIHRKENF
jgi:dihydrofolate reductase